MKDWEKFKTWLEKRGAVILPSENEWQLIRFKTSAGTSYISKDMDDNLMFTGESDTAYIAWKNNKAWRAVDRSRRHLKAQKARLAARDGKKCFACTAKLDFNQLTVEHLLSFKHGGTDNINNLCLMCEPCNRAMGHMPVASKILAIMQRRTLAIEWQEAAHV